MSADTLPPLPDTAYGLYYEWPDDEDGFGGSEVIDANGYTAGQMRAYALAAVAAERERCAELLTEYRVPVGNSAAGEMAAEWTMDALRELRDEIRAGGPR